ncbi:hypothetical protein EIP91_005372 [Steccherinum ochraceum]|uniref:Uncharacterized protein n=1 Tax=Steccherinum ochraceum TaxID=92696 RepID=A0A4R0RA11_9APHY|nr:hypothetical protein EIP91_005372 [Steccherinum ochraceum]
MRDWMSSKEIAKDLVALGKTQHVICGVYFWEFIVSLKFEWEFIRRRKTLGWSMVVYFFGRYVALFTLIGVIISLDTDKKINCEALYKFLAFGGQATIGLTCANLAIRTMGIWGCDRRVVIPLIVLIVGHWVILMQGVAVRADYNEATRCYIAPTKPELIAGGFVYAICFDLVMFMLSAWKLLLPKQCQVTPLVQTLRKDMLLSLGIAFLVNVPAVVILSLNLNPVMNTLPTLPAAIISSIMASRAVRRLANYDPSSASSS